MFNLPNISDLSINEGSVSKELQTILTSYQEIIIKLSTELDNIKKNQNNINEFNRIEYKTVNTEIEQVKNILLGYQSNLGAQTSKMSNLEKEVTIFRTPSWNNNISGVGNNNNEAEQIKSSSSINISQKNIAYPVNQSDGDLDNSEQSARVSFRGSMKNEENLNFLICLKLFENTVNTAKNVTQIQEHYVNFKNEISIIFNKKDNIIENLLQINKTLEETNSQLKNKVMVYEEEDCKGKFCIHCHKIFIPKFNEDKSCVYHSGKLKYYSCRECGGDEYYTCCMKCPKCLSGCKTGKHIAGL